MKDLTDTKPSGMPTEKLEAALLYVNDTFARVFLPVIVLGETARSIKEDDRLQGSKIEVGIRQKQYTREVESCFRDSFNDLIRNGNVLKTHFEGVDIEIKIITRQYSFFKYTDTIFYGPETYKLPNPFNKYYKARYLIK